MAKKTKPKKIVVKTADTTPLPKCPKGEYWNGQGCVPDIGE